MKTIKNKLYICAVLVAVVCLCLSFATVTAGSATVANAETTESHDIYLIDPTAVATVGNYLYIADNVDGSQGVVMRFEIAANGQPTKDTTVLTTGKRIVGLSGSDIKITESEGTIGTLYVIYADEAVLYDVSSDGTLTQNANTYTHITDATIGSDTLVDVAVGMQDTIATVYVLYNNRVEFYYQGSSNYWQITGGTITNAQSLFYCDDYMYYVYGTDTVSSCRRINKAAYPDKYYTAPTSIAPTGGFSFTVEEGGATYPALYNSTEIEFMQTPATDKANFRTLSGNSELTVIDIAATTATVFVLDSNKQVRVYTKTPTNNFARTDIHVGSDTVSQSFPTDQTKFTAYTLARSKGYPTNIVYRTTDTATSIAKVEDKFDGTFIVLDYDGSTSCPYYYVLIGNKFGWVKKSSAEATPSTDEKIAVISSKVNDTVSLKAKLSTLSNVYVYALPFGEADNFTYTQSANDMTEVDLLQTFKQTTDEGVVTWYYISFDDEGTTRKGFVKQDDLGHFSVDPKSTIGLEVEKSNLKINATLFEAVTVYATADMTQGAELYNANGIVKLYSGDRVFLVEKSEDGRAAMICILHKDNAVDYGWIDANRLINVNSITANTIAGLSFLGGAIILGILLLVVFRIKKKKSA